ncbi:MAG: DUF3137 domain-containing protein [Candidatus Auribacter fodinae]|jgi:hypothetical protein|uniref:DUF3137 domain-containing protein n=1 Tax=Candidatus Auribacter fodinae TaxID=2093366 RepID=A0A3A4R3F1_9BACT|nr:MAG: DUF3137 domain-containing protein [Candidatus Auribacter fodinae]
MKTIEDLQKFYNEELIKDLEVLETKRKKTLSTVFAVLLPLLAVIAVVMLFFSDKGSNALIFIVVIAIAVIFLIFSLLTRGYVSTFKDTVIHKIVEFIDPNLSYNKSNYVTSSEFMNSGIFLREPDRYKGEDYVRGILDKTNIEFSEINAEYETRDNKGRKSYHTIFKGLFFIADFNKDFKGRTLVLPDTAEKLFKGLGKMLQSWNISRPELIKLEDPEFEKHFAVYGTDQIEARYILSTSLMKRICDFREKSRKKLALSFVNSRLYIALTTNKNMLEPRLFRTLLNFKLVQEYFEDLKLAVDIVEDLNLNRRIWSKQ